VASAQAIEMRSSAGATASLFSRSDSGVAIRADANGPTPSGANSRMYRACVLSAEVSPRGMLAKLAIAPPGVREALQFRPAAVAHACRKQAHAHRIEPRAPECIAKAIRFVRAW
jgi:hypothetical protein